MLKRAIKWLYFDKVVGYTIITGIVILLFMFGVRSGGFNPVQYGSIDFDVGGTAFHRFIFKMNIPALITEIQVEKMLSGTTLLYVVVYPLMLLVQAFVYGIVGKIISVLSSDVLVLVFMCSGILLLCLAVAVDINPAESPLIIDNVRATLSRSFLVITTLPAMKIGLFLLGKLGGSVFTYLVFFPFMFIVQIIFYGFIGKLISAMFSSSSKEQE